MIEPIKIVYYYAPQDKLLRDTLESHLMTLKRLGQTTLRLNREIIAGTDWSDIQDARFPMADLILHLVSPDFIASDYHSGREMHYILEKHEAEEIWVIPIILRPTLWSNTPLGKLRVLPGNGKAVTEWTNRDAAFVTLVKGISTVVAALLVQKQARNFSGHANDSKIIYTLDHTCLSCGVRNQRETANCENCGDLLVIDRTMASQEENSSSNQSERKTVPSFFPYEIRICRYCGKLNNSVEQFCAICGGYMESSPHWKTPSEKNVGKNDQITRQHFPRGSLQSRGYSVEKVLDQGEMGGMVLARDTKRAHTLVVIQQLIFLDSGSEPRQEDVRNRELVIEALYRLSHPLIPAVTDSFREGIHYFMVQDYIVGENLENRIKRLMHPMPEYTVLEYASQVLDCLGCLEQQTPPIVHRDIKPANILVSSKDKHAHLLGFSIALALVDKNAKRKQATLGTPGYAPPEQYMGNTDPRSDLYALAATLHHLLTNRDPKDYPPFTYPAARLLNPRLSPDIERVLGRALKINATERYQKATEMKEAIDDILARR